MQLFGPPDISEMKEKMDIKGLMKAQENNDLRIVRDASFALADLGIVAPRGLLVGITSQDLEIRGRAYAALSNTDEFGWIVLLASLHDPYEVIRMGGLLGLVSKNIKTSLKPIGDCLINDPSEKVRESAVITLSKLFGAQALEYFMAARNDPSSNVRKRVEETLANLGY
jgi:HEAT repeat protein